MEAFFRLCQCGHRESQHRLAVLSEVITDFPTKQFRKECHVCNCEKFILAESQEEKK